MADTNFADILSINKNACEMNYYCFHFKEKSFVKSY
jgi:hypothetical protein